jgi:hypothetical protein
MNLNKIFTHRKYELDFDKAVVKCLKCGHTCDFKTFADSLLMFEKDKGGD